jgi:NADH-quinone oxidoreductase subunit H
VSAELFHAVASAGMIALAWTILLGLYLLIVVWAERRIAGLIQDRPGPNRVGPYGLFQTLADVPKMFLKEDVTPLYVDKLLHTVAPAIILIPALTTIAIVPLGAPVTIAGRTIPLVVADVNIGVLYLFALTSVSVYGLIVGAWASNNKYSLLGGLRASAQIISYELSMGIAAIAVFVSAGSLRPIAVVEWQGAHVWNCIGQALGFVVFVISAFAETNRVPFDLPEAESELVGGYHTEYSAFKFGMFFMSEYANMFVASAMIVTLYFGGWTLPFVTFSGNLGALFSLGVFLAKVFAWVFVFIWVRWTLPRFRYDQLMALGWKILLPLSVLNLLAVAWWAASGKGGP